MCFSGTDLLKAEADESQLKSERCTLKIRPDFLELFSHKQVWQCLDSDEMMSKYVKVTQEIFTVINTTLFTKLRRFFSLEVKCLTVQDLRGCILICLSTVEEIQMTTQSINPYCSYTCKYPLASVLLSQMYQETVGCIQCACLPLARNIGCELSSMPWRPVWPRYGILHSVVDAKLGTTNHKISEENKTCDAWYVKPICDWTCPDANRKSLQLWVHSFTAL